MLVLFSKNFGIHELAEIQFFDLADEFFLFIIRFTLHSVYREIGIGIAVEIKYQSEFFSRPVCQYHFFLPGFFRNDEWFRRTGGCSRCCRCIGNTLNGCIEYFEKGFSVFIGKLKFTGKVIGQTVPVYSQQFVLLFIPVPDAIKIVHAKCVEQLQEQYGFMHAKRVLCFVALTGCIEVAFVVLLKNEGIGLSFNRQLCFNPFVGCLENIGPGAAQDTFRFGIYAR